MTDMELFDQRVERFLKKQMSEEEELAFKHEISGDPEKLSRAKSIALIIKQMKGSGKDKDIEVAKSICKMDEKSFSDVVSGKYEAEFDERTTHFLKGRMTNEEEQLYFEELKASSEKLSRAQAIAMAVSQMKSQQKEKDKEIMEVIRGMKLSTFKKLVGIKPKYIALKWSLGIAASVLILFGVGFQQYGIYQTKKLGNAYGELFSEVQMVPRGSCVTDSVTVKRLTSTFHNIQNGDSLSASIEFLADLYKVHSYDVLPEYQELEIYIGWHLAIAYLKQGDKKAAIPILQKLTSDYYDTPIGKKAEELLDKLK